MRYPHTVTFQAQTEVQEASGQVTYTYADVPSLTELPARIVPEQLEDRADRMVVETDRFTIIVQGDRDIDRLYRVFTPYLSDVLDVAKVERPVLYRSQRTNATIVTAERIDVDDEVSG